VFTSNTFADNYAGMWLAASEGETLHDNKMHDNTRNFIARGIHAVDTSNTVDGKPIYYLVGANGAVIDGNVPGVDPGYLGIVDSQGVTVKNLEMSNVFDGVMVYNSKFVRVENVTATDVANGVSLSGARHVTVQDLTTRDAYKGLFVGSAPPGHTAGVGLPNLGLGVTQRVSDSSNVLVADANLTDTSFGIIQVGAERVTVDNATVPEAEFYGFLGLGGRDVTVRDSSFTDTVGTSGFFLGGLRHRVVNNTMTGEGNFSSLLHGYTLDLTVRDNTVADTDFGVAGVRSAGTVVEDNSVTDTTFGVLALEDGSETTVANNTVTDARVGLSSVFSGQDTFVENKATGNQFGFLAAGPTPGLTVEENTLVGNENGTWMDTVTSPTEDRGPCVNLFFDITECVTTQEGGPRPISVANNTIRENTNHGMVFFTQAELDSIAVRNNTIAGNAGFGVVNRNMTDAVVDARHNYWGASDGPSSPDASNPLEDPFTGEPADGAGDAVSGNATTGVADVRFDAWLTEAPSTTASNGGAGTESAGSGLAPGPLAGAVED
jgi:nitrous oxidase accessory protein NosD